LYAGTNGRLYDCTYICVCVCVRYEMLRGFFDYIYIYILRITSKEKTPRKVYAETPLFHHERYKARSRGTCDVVAGRTANCRVSSLFPLLFSGPFRLFTRRDIYIIYGRALLFPSAVDSDWQRHLPDLSTRLIIVTSSVPFC